MVNLSISSSLTISLILSHLLLSSALDSIAANQISAGAICNSTPYPSFCRSVLLPAANSSSNVYDYGRLSVRKSLSAANKFLSLINKYLRRSKTLTPTAVAALQDCRYLASLNIDYLLSSFQTVNATRTTLPTLEADDVQTLLSAILTNTQTCLDGLQDTASSWSLKSEVFPPLANDTRLYSVSLALFTKGWVKKKKKSASWVPGKTHKALTKGSLPLKMSSHHRKLYESVSRRELLQTNSTDDAVQVSDIVIVSQDGSQNFTTITDAVAAAPNNTKAGKGYFVIYVTAGVYEEYITIAKNKKYLMMIGDGINQTIITGSHNFVDGWTTFNSPTFAVGGLGFVAVNITFRNTAGAAKHQAVAVRNGADLSSFYRCSFEAYQDTLYVHSLRQYYRDCDIYGTVDFIFGNAATVFQNCNIYPRLPMDRQFNAITAQGRTDPNQNTGISIQNCKIRAADDLATSGVTVQTYLGRPWKQYSRTVYMKSFIDGVINPLGWHEWDGDFALNTSYYAEFDNTGPGSDTSGRVNWPGYHVIDATDAVNFTVSNFLFGDDWLDQTAVPYYGGLEQPQSEGGQTPSLSPSPSPSPLFAPLSSPSPSPSPQVPKISSPSPSTVVPKISSPSPSPVVPKITSPSPSSSPLVPKISSPSPSSPLVPKISSPSPSPLVPTFSSPSPSSPPLVPTIPSPSPSSSPPLAPTIPSPSPSSSP